MISYAGVPLPDPDPETLAWVRANVPFDWLTEWSARGCPGPVPPMPRGPVRPGVLVWPAGASRWGYAHYLVTANQLDPIRSLVYANGGYAAQGLVIDDGAARVTVPMYPLPPRPLQQTTEADTPCLLTLVDGRFFWWFVGAGITVTAGTTTWAQLFAAHAAALNVTLAVDPVPAAYLTPPASLGGRWDPLPPLLDAAAAAVGLRLVAGLDGSYRLWNAANSQGQLAANLAAAPGVTRAAGGTLALTPG